MRCFTLIGFMAAAILSAVAVHAAESDQDQTNALRNEFKIPDFQIPQPDSGYRFPQPIPDDPASPWEPLRPHWPLSQPHGPSPCRCPMQDPSTVPVKCPCLCHQRELLDLPPRHEIYASPKPSITPFSLELGSGATIPLKD